jgi:UDP-2-acetamido-2,6-beta-L-arabino-hexul-4-ose reductase
MAVGVTGLTGFLGWHIRCAIEAGRNEEIVPIGHREFEDIESMDLALSKVDCVIHLAGVNRAPESVIAEVNILLAQRLADGLKRGTKPIALIFANSIHVRGDSTFGISKAKAAEILRMACQAVQSPFMDAIIPNVFGEHGKPYYNSVVATFCHQLSIGETPRIQVDRDLSLVHAQSVAEILLKAAANPSESEILMGGHVLSVSAVLEKLQAISESYFEGRLPDLSDSFTRDLFNTYRSYTFPSMWPILTVKHSDARGELVEAVRGAGGETQVFFSTTKPGYTRGNHFHLRKIERFLVLQGQASIKLRRLFTDEVIEFHVSGETPAILDMPTLWTHSITNTGDQDLLTLFYADDEYNPSDPDTYWVDV